MDKDTYLDVNNLKMYFPIRRGLLGKPYAFVKAIDNISFSLHQGETFGLVGESGCGKTTTGRCILRMYDPTGGKIIFKGDDIVHYTKKQIKAFRQEVQIIFQDPYGSLDPRQSIESIIREALFLGDSTITKKRCREQVKDLLNMVGLASINYSCYPHELSGGQRQRVSIARALAVKPDLIICDEPISALDVSIQAQIINLFMRLQKDLNLTYLFITHDLAVVRHISDVIGVMYLGKFVEITDSDDLYRNPLHPYTKALLSAVPITDYYVEKKRERIILQGEVPSPIDSPSGCPFHPRCPYAIEVCSTQKPSLKNYRPNHLVACHRVGEIN